MITNISSISPNIPVQPAADQAQNAASALPQDAGRPERLNTVKTPNDKALSDDAATQNGKPPSAEEVNKALEEVNKALRPVAQNLLFSIDDDTKQTVIKVIDSSTDEVIRQIPSEEVLAISKALDKLQGLLIKQEA